MQFPSEQEILTSTLNGNPGTLAWNNLIILAPTKEDPTFHIFEDLGEDAGSDDDSIISAANYPALVEAYHKWDTENDDDANERYFDEHYH